MSVCLGSHMDRDWPYDEQLCDVHPQSLVGRGGDLVLKSCVQGYVGVKGDVRQGCPHWVLALFRDIAAKDGYVSEGGNYTIFKSVVTWAKKSDEPSTRARAAVTVLVERDARAVYALIEANP